jgi:hypothetical protein
VNQILKVCGPPRSTRLKAEEGDENAVDADGLGLRQVADIAANHGEVTLPAANSLAASSAVPVSITLRRTVAPSTHELACHGGHRLGTLAVDRADGEGVTGWAYQRYASRLTPVTT